MLQSSSRIIFIAEANSDDVFIAKFERIDRDIQVWTKEASDMQDNFLHFQAREKYYEILSFMAAEKELLQRNYPIKSGMHYYNVKNIIIMTDIAIIEVIQRNFQSVVPLFQFCEKEFSCRNEAFFQTGIILLSSPHGNRQT